MPVDHIWNIERIKIMSLTTLETAMKWLSSGNAPIPMYPHTKIPAIAWERYVDKLPQKYTVERWFKNGVMNIGLICGGENNLCVLDFDSMRSYASFKNRVSTENNIWRDVPSSYSVKTSRGVHIYLLSRKREITRKTDTADIRAYRSLVVIPPSIHPSGVKYECMNKNNTFILTVDSLSQVFPEPVFEIKKKYDPDIIDIIESKMITSYDKDCIKKIKERLPMLVFAQSFTELYPSGGNGRYYIGKCMLHNDTKPSFWVDTYKDRCGCYANCVLSDPVKRFDIIDLYKFIFGVSTKEAVISLSRVL